MLMETKQILNDEAGWNIQDRDMRVHGLFLLKKQMLLSFNLVAISFDIQRSWKPVIIYKIKKFSER